MEQFSNLGALSSQARLMPYMVQGEPQGFRLTRLQQDSVLQKIGLQNGDVLQKVNGLSITSPDDALRAYQFLQQEGTVRLEILRSNRPTTLTYEIR
jgi:general secretion pathway protein C